MEFLENPSEEKLENMSMTQLKEVARGLDIEIELVTPSRRELTQEIIECLVNRNKLPKKTEACPQLEMEGKAINVQLELARIELAKLKIASDEKIARMEMEERMARMALEERMANSQVTRDSTTDARSDNNLFKFKKFVPEFDPANQAVDQYFNLFERAAIDFQFPKDKYAALVRTALTKGKAKEVILTLKNEQFDDYAFIKEAVMKRYALVPEKYRQIFRNLRKTEEENHIDFLRNKEIQLERWIRSKDATDNYEKLKNLMLLEEFLRCIGVDVKTHIANRGVDQADMAARLADDYVLINHPKHQVKRFEKPPQGNANEPNTRSYQNNTQKKQIETAQQVVCQHCNKVGHTRKECWLLNKKSSKQTDKVMGAYDTNENNATPQLVCKHCNKTGHARKDCWYLKKKDSKHTEKFIGAYDRTITAKAEPINENLCESKANDMMTEKSSLNDFLPFISEGFIALPDEKATQKPVKILRDTGASVTLILEDLLPLSEKTYTGQNVLLKGIEMGHVEVPLHHINLTSELITGPVIVGVKPTLPFDGISVIIGNDLAKGRVKPELIVTHYPELKSTEKDDTELYPICAITRGMKQQELNKPSTQNKESDTQKEIDLEATFFSKLIEEPKMNNNEVLSPRQQLIREQQKDAEIVKLRENAVEETEISDSPVHYFLQDAVLMRRWRPRDAAPEDEWRVVKQIVVPSKYRPDILEIAHDSPFAGHLGVNKTYQRILPYFYWPGLKRDVTAHCKSCHTCQIVGKPNQSIPVAPLQPVPAFHDPFTHIIIDCVGPLPKSKSGHQYLLTMMCNATRYPEAVPLRSINAEKITEALTTFFTRYGLPKSVQTDQGTNFTSKLFQQVLDRLKIQHRMSTSYHPESQGALERFHQTLKTMLKTYCNDHQKDWDKGVPFVLFAAREAVQESLGFSPFELVFGHTVRGPLKLLQEAWTNAETKTSGLLDYVDKFKNRLFNSFVFVRNNLQQAQRNMKTWYDKKSRVRRFAPGEKVLLFLPTPGQPLAAKYFGPYEVDSQVSEVNYVIKTPNRRKEKRLVHVNMIKPYVGREKVESKQSPPTQLIAPIVSIPDEQHGEIDQRFSGCKLKNSAVLENIDEKLTHLKMSERNVIKSIILEYPMLFNDVPSRTNLIEHDIILHETATPIKQHPYRVNPNQLTIIQKEIQYMLDNDIITHSSGEWSSPCLIVPKADKTARFCTDYRKVNAVTKTDCYPIARVDDLIDRVGDAMYVTKIDLLSGYFQVPLSSRAQEISSFTTPFGLFKYKVMPFGLKNSPSTFQRLINSIIRDIPCCDAYLDDIVIYSQTFATHTQQLRQLFSKLANANLTVNLAKCNFGQATIEYLGHIVGSGLVKPVDEKISAIKQIPIPSCRKQVRSFLGMVGFYRKFCPNFSTIAYPLTELLKKNTPYQWTEECTESFNQLKVLVCHPPVLATPKFSEQFYIATDASDVGTGSVLFQIDHKNVEHPIAYHSQKFSPCQKNYSTIEKEMLGIILALKHFDYYLTGSPHDIVIFTDHNPIKCLEKLKTNQRLVRWSLFLQSYSLKILHIKGTDNKIADLLSRQMK